MSFNPTAERKRIWSACRSWRHTPMFHTWSEKSAWVDEQVASRHVGRIVAFQRGRRS